MAEEKENGYEPSNIRVRKPFYDLDTDVQEMLKEMNFNPIQQLAELFPAAANAGEYNAAYNIAKYLSGYVKPQAKQSEQKVVVQILHQGEAPKTLTANNVPIELANYKVLNEEEIKQLEDGGSNTVTVSVDA